MKCTLRAYQSETLVQWVTWYYRHRWRFPLSESVQTVKHSKEGRVVMESIEKIEEILKPVE